MTTTPDAAGITVRSPAPPEPPTISRWTRLRWAWQEHRVRMRLASWIAGFDVEQS